MTPSSELVCAETRSWLVRAVVGLNLCPFAKAPFAKEQIRYVVSDATDTAALLEALCREMRHLCAADPTETETTLLIHPQVLTDFADYNDFLGLADAALERLGYRGILQVASFHPQYCFAATDPSDIGNATNRSPYPTLHLLRESSVARAAAAFPDAATIYQANIRTLQALGSAGWNALQAQFTDDAAAAVRSRLRDR